MSTPVVPGYDLVRVIGRGGMGIVWAAVEHRFERSVAVKVHREETGASPEELWREALVAARLGDPGIVRVFDVGLTLDQKPYYAMELVDGTDLSSLIADGALEPRRAVRIAADIARAAGAAHEHGIIHRDLKPRNVLVDPAGRVRVADFGIAVDTKRGDVEREREGEVTGSPQYMAPEQWKSEPLSPATDVYATGVILHEMLTGERPFAGVTIEELIRKVLVEDAPAPSRKKPGLDSEIDRVVALCLARDPAHRFATGRSLASALDAILDGRSVERPRPAARPRYVAKKPSLAEGRDSAKSRIVVRHTFAATSERLWRYVASTDRLNKIVGLPPIDYTDEPLPQGGSKRVVQYDLLGFHLDYREYPYEWIAPREIATFRLHRTGPLVQHWTYVKFEPHDDGRTDVSFEVAINPRHFAGRVGTFVQLKARLGPALERFFHVLDAHVTGRGPDPFDPRHEPTTAQRRAVSAACDALHGRGFRPEIVERLAMHLSTGSDFAIATLRPNELADAWGFERAEMLDVLVHTAVQGLIEPAWDVVCPACLMVHESFAELRDVKRVGTCKPCARSFERDLAGSVELVFRPAASFRRVENAKYCVSGPGLRPHVLAQQVLAAGEERVIEIELRPGSYRVASAGAKSPRPLLVSAAGFERTTDVTAHGDRIDVVPGVVAAGTVTLLFRNRTDHEETFRLELASEQKDALYASVALAHPTFRDHFGEQLPNEGEHLQMGKASFVFAALRSKSALFSERGDGGAYAAAAALEEMVVACARTEEGSMIHASISGVVAVFPSAVGAARAAFEMQKADNAGAASIAVHKGPCLVLNHGGKTEFFGETIDRGLALLDEGPARSVVLTDAIADDRDVLAEIDARSLRAQVRRAETGGYAGRRVTLVERRCD